MRFVDNGDGTITDTKTGLMWEKSGSTDCMDWNTAHDYAKDCCVGSYADWRLPSVQELQNIVDYDRHDPAINHVFISESSNYWSATTYADATGYAWCVYFYSGLVGIYNKTTSSYYVRCCRTIQEA